MISKATVAVTRCGALWRPDELASANSPASSMPSPDAHGKEDAPAPSSSASSHHSTIMPRSLDNPKDGNTSLAKSRLPSATVLTSGRSTHKPPPHGVVPIARTLVPEDSPKSDHTKPDICRETVEMSITKYQLLKPNIEEKYVSLGVHITSAAKDMERKRISLTLQATKSTMEQAKMFLYEQAANLEEQELELNDEMVCYLTSSAGRTEVDSRLRDLRAQLIESSGQLVVGGHTDDCSEAVNRIRGMFCQETILLRTPMYKYITKQLNEMCTALGTRIVSVEENDQKKVCITLEATKSAIDRVKLQIYDELANVEEQDLQLTPEMTKALQSDVGQTKLDQQLVRLKAVMVDIKGHLTLVGEANDCSKAFSLIKNMFCQAKLVVPLAKYRAIQAKIYEKFFSLNIRIVSVDENDNDKKAYLALEAMQSSVDEAKLYIYDQTVDVDEYVLPQEVSDHMLDITEMNSMLGEMKAQVVKVGNQLIVVGSSEDCSKAASLILDVNISASPENLCTFATSESTLPFRIGDCMWSTKSLAPPAPRPSTHSGDWSTTSLASVASMSSTHFPATFSKPEPVKEISQETVEIPHGKYKFMKEKIAEKCSSLDVRIVSESESGTDQKVNVVLEGTNEAIIQVRLYAFEEMMDVEERSLKLSTVTARILKGSSGKGEAESKLIGLKVELMDVKGHLSIVGHQDDVPKALSIVERMFSTDHIQVTDHHRIFMKTGAWKEAVRGVQRSRCIEVKEKASSIELEGIDHEVKDAKATLLASLKKSSFKKESVEVKKGVYRFIKTHCTDSIDDIQSQ